MHVPVVCYLGDRYTYTPWYSIAVVLLTQSSTHKLYFNDHKNLMLIGCALTKIVHFEFRIAAGNKLEG